MYVYKRFKCATTRRYGVRHIMTYMTLRLGTLCEITKNTSWLGAYVYMLISQQLGVSVGTLDVWSMYIIYIYMYICVCTSVGVCETWQLIGYNI